MNCPYCRRGETRVSETRKPEPGSVQRRRGCPSCGRRFVTTERVATHEIQVRKSNGKVEFFTRQKIRRSIEKAASGQRLLPALVDVFVDRVIDQLVAPADGAPIPTREIGLLVLQSLEDNTKSTDVVRIRFAMVFLGRDGSGSLFEDTREFRTWLQREYPHVAELVGHTPEGVVVVKRKGQRQAFDLRKLERSIGIAAKGRGNDDQVRAFATRVAGTVLADLTGQPIITSQQMTASVLRELRAADALA